jgi:hypothetical protein
MPFTKKCRVDRCDITAINKILENYRIQLSWCDAMNKEKGHNGTQHTEVR